MIQQLRNALSDTGLLTAWVVLVILALIMLVRDLCTSNSHIKPLLQLVWFMTVLYSGPIGLTLYYTSRHGNSH